MAVHDLIHGGTRQRGRAIKGGGGGGGYSRVAVDNQEGGGRGNGVTKTMGLGGCGDGAVHDQGGGT